MRKAAANRPRRCRTQCKERILSLSSTQLAWLLFGRSLVRSSRSPAPSAPPRIGLIGTMSLHPAGPASPLLVHDLVSHLSLIVAHRIGTIMEGQIVAKVVDVAVGRIQ